MKLPTSYLWPKRLNENSNNNKQKIVRENWEKMQTLITFQTIIKASKYQNYAIYGQRDRVTAYFYNFFIK
jgi:hypothetical protein